MKTLELNLQKRLLIVEGIVEVMNMKLKFICKGSELTEEIAKSFSREVRALNPVDGTYSTCYPLAGRVINATRKALQSFKSLLCDQGYYWGENPLQSTKPTDDLTFYDSKEERSICIEKWQEAESKTFNPEKTLIFEIL